ncbi:MAG: ROK family protein [Candidatus Aminicenantes bacterium]|jgi:glucokinase|nr:MAG: ROK family protein [Candidatus Aminicenantes bacterium]
MKELVTLGVDLGGTKVETALVDEQGHVLSSHREPTHPDRGAKKIIDDIVNCVVRCLDKGAGQAAALGIGVAGQIDRTGVVRASPNLRWENVPLKKLLEEKVRMPVVVINDVRAALWGEWRHGAGRGTDDLIVVFVGTGIGGGVVSGGRVLEGCGNAAGELGHMVIVRDGRKCHCPNRGCLEAYAGGWAIAERAQTAVGSDPAAGQRLTFLAGRVEDITAGTVAQAFDEGDDLARRLVAETADLLGQGLVSIVNAFNPCRLILGGGVIEGIPVMLPIVERVVRERALSAASDGLQIIRAALGNEAGIVGAAALARTVLEVR